MAHLHLTSGDVLVLPGTAADVSAALMSHQGTILNKVLPLETTTGAQVYINPQAVAWVSE